MHIWEDNIKMAIRELRWGCIDWIVLPQDRDGGGGGGVRL
jgi:hypothetical protein